jgi:Mor family transcriptional regulator
MSKLKLIYSIVILTKNTNKMKKKNSILFTVIIFTSIIISSCGNGSVKGKWSEDDKKKFNAEMEKGDLSNLGEDKAKWLEIFFSKAEAKYSSFAEADKDQEGCKALALEANDVLLANGSVKGKWSDSDKQKFHAIMEKGDLSNLGDNKTKWIELLLNKTEAKYSCLYEADKDETGCQELATECNNELIKE